MQESFPPTETSPERRMHSAFEELLKGQEAGTNVAVAFTDYLRLGNLVLGQDTMSRQISEYITELSNLQPDMQEDRPIIEKNKMLAESNGRVVEGQLALIRHKISTEANIDPKYLEANQKVMDIISSYTKDQPHSRRKVLGVMTKITQEKLGISPSITPDHGPLSGY